MSSYSYGGKELASAFRTVRKNTIQVAEDIPESQYGHVATPECHSVARKLTHIALATRIWDEIHRKQRLTTMAGIYILERRILLVSMEAQTSFKSEISDCLPSDR